jgi:predicted ATPase/DNA-binding SARP family transcriptional activator/Tfp pilus assembly protein PilF
MDASPSLVLLGSPHLRRGGARFDLQDALPGYLVAYLATRGDWVLREEVAVLLWPEAAESEAQNNLRVNLTRLRPHLARWGIEPQFIAERRRLRLDLDSDVRAVRAAHARGAWVETAEAARGQFLDGMSFRAFAVLGEWARAEREALRALWRDAVLRAGDAIAPQSRLDLAARYLAADPFDEDIVRVQLGALAALGRSDEAQRLFERFSEQVRAELGVDVTVALAEYARRLGRPAAGEAPSPARPDADEPLIGREAELAAIAQLVSDTRLVTVVGLGGIGKTRLARALQAELAPQFNDGVLWLSLIELSGVAEIVRRLADLLQLKLEGGRDAVEQIAEHIGDRVLLLILDNAEHLLAERAALNALLTQLLDSCSQLHCLVTSRETLNHPRERSVRLEGLAAPDENAGAAALGTAAVRLFVQQAQRRRPAFDPRSAVADLAQIARLTGGMPLGLRIAAGWAGFLSCADIAAEIRRGLDALEPGSGEPAGVRATLARSWIRLSMAEQSALAALSVFSSPFSAQAAREVAQAALPVLGSLTERCLLLPSEAGDGAERSRFEMHPLVRAFAAEQLAADPRAQRQTHDRHASHVMRMLALWADFRLSVDQRKGVLAVGSLLPEALAAWRRALAGGRSDFIAAAARVLGNYFELKGRWDEGIALFSDIEPQLDAEQRGERAALAAVADARAQLLHRNGHPDAEDVARRALEGSRSIEHRAGIRSALCTLGNVLLNDGRLAQALETYGEALDMARVDDDRAMQAAMLNGIALIRLRQGDSAAAETMWRETLALQRDIGNWIGAVRVYNNLGCLLMDTGRFDEAQAPLDEGLRLCDTVGIAAVRPVLLVNLGQLHLKAGRLQAATTFTELAVTESRSCGDRQAQIWSLLMLVEIALRQRDAGRIAGPLRDALRLARATSDVQNLLGSLNAYAGWSLLRDRRETAALVWLAVLAHPRLDAQNRQSAEQQWEAAGFDDELVAAARRNAQGSDALALVEQALVELDRSAAPSPRSIGQDSAASNP